MKNALLLIGVILYATIPGIGQGQYPFNAEDNTSSISAYWYNCKPDSVTIASLNETAYFHSSLQIYGPCISDSFSVEVEVFLSDNSLAYSNRFPVKKGLLDKGYQIDMKNKYFRIMSSVDLLNSDPDKIKVTIRTAEQQVEKWITCRYRKISGYMTDFNGNPLRSFLAVYPDAFEDASAVWSDNEGYYEISLPERTYNCFYVNDGKYKSTTLEAWAWHMIIDNDQEIDFKIGTGEVYNCNYSGLNN